MIIADIETDGLLEECTKIHCAVFLNLDTGDIQRFTSADDEHRAIREIIQYILIEHVKGERFCFHNGVEFDWQVLKKIFNYNHKGKYRDTLLMSRIMYPDIELAEYKNAEGKTIKIKAPHSVEAWGVRLGIKKPEHEDWSKYTPEMLHRCEQDVLIQAKLYKKIMDEIEEKNLQMDTVFDMEQRVWEIIRQQSENGWLFDKEKAKIYVSELNTELSRVRTELGHTLPYRIIKTHSGACTAFKKNGELTCHAANWVGDRFDEVMGDFSRVKFEKVDIGSPAQLKEYLLSLGWKPTKYNFKKDKYNKPERDENGKLIKTSPKSPKDEEWDELAEQLNNPSISLLAKYYKTRHRHDAIKGWLENLDENNRIHGSVITCGTNTARMKHKVVVNVPKAEEEVFFGKEMRSLFIVPEDKILIGCDASALEARCEAHYLYKYDPNMSKELLEGDIHSINAEVFGCDRSTAKGAKYAITYGCGAPKLSTILKCTVPEAEKLLENYWEVNWGLKKLKDDLEKAWEYRGYIKAIDGRPLHIRYKHALVNTLFQSCGSIIMKYALCYLDTWLKQYGIDDKFVGNFHDEFQIEALFKNEEIIKKFALKALQKAGNVLYLNIPIEGECKSGKNWAETH